MVEALFTAIRTLSMVVVVAVAYLVTLGVRGVEVVVPIAAVVLAFALVASTTALAVALATLLDHWRITRLRYKMYR